MRIAIKGEYMNQRFICCPVCLDLNIKTHAYRGVALFDHLVETHPAGVLAEYIMSYESTEEGGKSQ